MFSSFILNYLIRRCWHYKSLQQFSIKKSNMFKPQDYIDLRSDVISVPPQQMLQAMVEAEVGDDVFEDDPTANKFQQTIAKYFGFQASIIFPSTTMANLASVLLLTKPGDEVIIWGNSHTIQRESAGIALIGGVQTRQILEDTGIFTVDQIKKKVRKQAQHVTFPDTALIMVQNATFTGEVWPLQTLAEIKSFAEKQNIKVLLDGARILNAVANYGCEAKQIGKYCDVMTMCLSKGLCCPFGSLLLGSSEAVKKVRHIRKSLGGGMRQIGIIGAAGLYALQHTVPEIKIDNQMAKYIGSLLCQIPGIVVDCSKIQANMVNFKVNIQNFDHNGYHAYLLQNLVKIKPLNEDKQQYRVVTHRTIRQNECKKFVQLTKKFFGQYEQRISRQTEQLAEKQSASEPVPIEKDEQK